MLLTTRGALTCRPSGSTTPVTRPRSVRTLRTGDSHMTWPPRSWIDCTRASVTDTEPPMGQYWRSMPWPAMKKAYITPEISLGGSPR